MVPRRGAGGLQVVAGPGDRVAVGDPQHLAEKGHPGEHPVLGLLEVPGAGVGVHLGGDLVHPRQGVQDDGVGPRPGHLGRVEDVAVAQPLSLIHI